MKLMNQKIHKSDYSDNFDHYQELVKKSAALYQSCNNQLGDNEKQTVLASAKFFAEQALAIAADTQLFNLLARIHLDLGEVSQAESYINQALSLKPNNAALLYSAGHIFLAANQFIKAEELFERSYKISRTATNAGSSLAYTYLAQGKSLEAFQLYRELAKTSDDVFIRSKLFESASYMTADFYADELEQDLLRYLTFEGVNHNDLHSLVSSLLWHKFKFSDNGTPLSFDQLATDPLLLASMNKLFFQQPIFERMLISMRQSLLLDAVKNMNLKEEHMPFLQALAMQAYLNEYIWPITEQEQEILTSLEQLVLDVSDKDWQPNDIAVVVMLCACYSAPNQSAMLEVLSKKTLAQWPNELQPLITKILIEPQQEREIAKSLPHWHAIADDTSLKVAEQYNENPYPRWIDLGTNTVSDYLLSVKREFPQAKLPYVAQGEKLKILVAGTGTGRQAIRLARYFADVEVLAVDISSSALAYAKRKADEMKVENIHFMQADILDLTSLPMKFHVVECSGVLHHMAEPEAGLKVLRSLLVDNGLMKIALYSRTARENIIKLREMISKASLSSARQIRLFRQALLLEKIPGDWQDILKSPDFYSLSSCRDLLFHCQEHQFDLPEIEKLLTVHKLSMLGLLVNKEKEIKYREQFTNFDKANINHWHQLETQNPQLFAEMYQFYCQ